MSWSQVALAEVVDAKSGFASGESVEDGVAQVRMNNVTSGGRLDWTRLRRVPTPKRGIDGLLAEPGDVLFNATNSPELVGKSAYFAGFSERLTYSNHFLRLRPHSRLDGRYLAYWLGSRWKARVFEGMCRAWVNQASVSKDQLLALSLPLPPVDEQRRIAAILDQANALRSKRQRANALLEQLECAIFAKTFGNALTNSRSYPKLAIREIGKVTTGNTPSRADPGNYGVEIEWVKSDNLNNNEYYVTQAAELLSKKGRLKARTVRPGAVLVTCIAGSPDCIGNIGMTDREVAFNQQINALEIEQGDPAFVYAQLRLHKGLVQAASTNSMKGMVSKSRFEEIKLIFPPLEEQSRYAQVEREIRSTIDFGRRGLVRLDALFASLQHRAFAGEL